MLFINFLKSVDITHNLIITISPSEKTKPKNKERIQLVYENQSQQLINQMNCRNKWEKKNCKVKIIGSKWRLNRGRIHMEGSPKSHYFRFHRETKKKKKKKKRVLETNSSKHEKIKTWKTKTKSEKGGQKIRDILDPTPNKAGGTV